MTKRITPVMASSSDKVTGEVRTTRVDEPVPFLGRVRTGELMMNMSYDVATSYDSDGNKVQVYLWVNGSWLIKYKDKQYLMTLDDNVSALIDWINGDTQ